MLKRIVILAISVLCAWYFTSAHASATSPGNSPSSAKASARKATSTQVTKKVTRRRVRRRWNPWHLSSFGDSTVDDDSTGEDPAARAAAIEALGRWNGSVTVVDPNSGRILAIVNQKLALESAFTPCSTFKPVVAVGALKEGLITSDTELRVGRRTKLNLAEALAHSNNQFFGKLGQMLGFERVSEYAHTFGLGEKAGWNIPGESPGKFPEAPPKDGVSLLSSHGEDIQVTPLQMAAIISAIANGGTMYYLQYPRTPEEAAEFKPIVRRHLEELSEYFPYVKQGLAGAVIYGTARLAYNPEEQIFGKTGTCSEDGARLGWFVSYANAEQPKYVVIVLLRGGKMMYGPHAAEIAGKVYRGLRQRTQVAEQPAPTSSASVRSGPERGRR